MRSTIVLLIAITVTGIATREGLATQTWCAIVKTDVPDGYLNLRGGPAADYPVLFRLRPGEYIELDTGRCAETFAEGWTKLAHACVPEGSSWSFVEHAPRLGDRERGGWVNTRHLDQARCEWDN
jgi:hypothetical protein